MYRMYSVVDDNYSNGNQNHPTKTRNQTMRKINDMTDYFNQEQIITMKRTKSGTKPTDIKPMITEYSVEGNKLVLILSAGAVNLNPNLVISTAEEYYNTQIKVNKVFRTDVFNTAMESFK